MENPVSCVMCDTDQSIWYIRQYGIYVVTYIIPHAPIEAFAWRDANPLCSGTWHQPHPHPHTRVFIFIPQSVIIKKQRRKPKHHTITTMSTTAKQQMVLHHQHPMDRHTMAVNLARRYTVQNENDLMQVRLITTRSFRSVLHGPWEDTHSCRFLSYT